MECLEQQIWDKATAESLKALKIEAPNETVRRQVQINWDLVSKPLDGMGTFEALIAQIGAIVGTTQIDIAKKAVIIMCADNGVVAEGISQSGQEVTALVAKQMTLAKTSVGKMAALVGADTIPVDIGINQEAQIEGLLQKRIRRGTRNFYQEPAMTEQETARAIATGIRIVADCKRDGYQILATGEMGIGNTTTSSAITAALLDCDAAQVTGRGAGLSDEGLARKRQVIEESIAKYNLRKADPFTVLKTVGGLDIAGLVGVCIGGALYHVPIVLDGAISLASALLAERLLTGTKAFLIASHTGKEPLTLEIAKELGLSPLIAGNLALGEGTGAVMMLSLLDIAMTVYSDSNKFGDSGIEQYTRF